MKIYLATWQEQNQEVSLNNKKNITRLLSYYFIRTNNNFLMDYIKRANENLSSCDRNS